MVVLSLQESEVCISRGDRTTLVPSARIPVYKLWANGLVKVSLVETETDGCVLKTIKETHKGDPSNVSN